MNKFTKIILNLLLSLPLTNGLGGAIGNKLMRTNINIPIFFLLVMFIAVGHAYGQKEKLSGAKTIINTFNQVKLDGQNQWRTQTFGFPLSNAGKKYRQIMMHYNLSCPDSGCDPYDRIISVNIVRPIPGKKYEAIEIARMITCGGNTANWDVDVTDYSSLLKDSVIIYLYCSTGSMQGKGVVSTVSFEFIEGNPRWEAYKVINLWSSNPYNRWQSTSTTNDLDQHLMDKKIIIDSNAVKTKFKSIVTGHTSAPADKIKGQLSFRQYLVTDYSNFIQGQTLKSDCNGSACSSDLQLGLGWCPGAQVFPWEKIITDVVAPGKTAVLSYNIEPASCCDAWYMVQTQLIFYRKTK